MSSRPSEDAPRPGRVRAERAERAEEIFFDALELPPSERRELVADRCRGEAELEREVRSLLEAHEQTGPLDRLQGDLVRWGEALLDDGDDGLPAAVGGPHLGRYEIRDRLGSGGMAVVFRAHDPKLERAVAIKVIGRRVRDRPEMLARFEQEARAASALSHPNIITVHDFGEQDEHPFLVMELVDGESLRDRLDGPMAVDEMVRLGIQLADGLAAAHEAGVVHRDFKPENILIDGRGTARILDFGLAVFHALDPEPASGDEGDAGTESAASTVAGTVGYAAPEVLRGKRADHRADQFALGAILYEMATGRGAFPADDFPRGLAATLKHEPEPVGAHRDDLPAPLTEVIERCLAKRPEDRYERTGEILSAFEALAGSRAESPGATGRTRAERRRGSLPTPATPLFGRRHEIHRLTSLLTEDGIRLVTLVGVGGSGKTRLAIEAARELEADAPGRVVFVSLAGIQEAELVVPTVAAAVGGVQGAAGGVELPALVAALSEPDGPVLLVLDNFEHVIAAAPVVGKLLEASPELTVLVTSRELLNLRAEHGFPVAPLDLPPEGTSITPEALHEVPAVALFVARARAAAADFRLTGDNAPAVAELCRRLEGLPLALELAAARVRTLPPAAMLRRLENRMGLLTGGPRDLPRRQRTLRAALDWSHDLLDEVEQKAFRRLSVFSDGFTLEAAEAVADPFGRLERDIIDLVEALHDRSLLQRVPTASSAEDGEPRFAMLETIREYAAEQLERWDEHASTRQAHAAYFLVLAEEAEAAFNRGRGSEWLDRFRVEEANFRVALDRLIETDNAAWGLRMAQGLFHFWELGASFSEGRRRYDQLLALPSAQDLTRERAKALFAAGVLAASQRDHATGLAHHRRSLELHRRMGDRWGQAVALNGLGIQFTDQERYAEARACYEDSMELWEELGESHGAAASLSNFAYVLRSQGELQRSRRLYQEAAAMFERLGDPVGAAWEMSHEADVARDQAHRPGRPDRDPESEAEAARLYRRALARFRELEEPWGIGSALMDLGTLAQESGDLDHADASFREALEMFCRVGHQRGVVRVLQVLATLAGEQGDHPEVLRLAGAAERLRERLGRPPTDPDLEEALDAAVAGAYERVGSVEGEVARRHGREQSIDRLLVTLSNGRAGDQT